jgi:tripartite-type tricarboxylate transporter receptor subunit TctC
MVPFTARLNRLAVIPLIALLAAACGDSGTGGDNPPNASGADNGDDCAFYQDEEVTFTVPHAAGGGFDRYARFVAPHLEEAIGASSLTVSNEPGAGGLVALNELAAANPDAHEIALMNATGTIGAALGESEGVLFDLRDLTYVGRVNAPPTVLITGPDSGITSIDEVIGTEGLNHGTTGVGSSSHIAALVLQEALETPFNIVAGYKGTGEAQLGLVANDIQLTTGGIDSVMGPIEEGDAIPLLIVGSERIEELPDVPAINDLDLSEENAELARTHIQATDLIRVLVAPPDLPEDRTNCLRSAFEDVMANSEVQSEAEENSLILNYLPGEEVAEIIDNIVSDPSQAYVEVLEQSAG